MRRRTLAAALLLAPGPAWARPSDGALGGLNGQHPSAYYIEATRLLGQGAPDDAVFLFYLGQLRFRTHLTARPERGRAGDGPLFGSLSESVGRPINEYAFGDLPALLATLDAVLAYDRQVPDRFTPPSEFPEAHRQVREGMAAFRENVASRQEEIRRQRQANGLENRR
nr:hypothetical protein [uncultured Roseococcus sp.]